MLAQTFAHRTRTVIALLGALLAIAVAAAPANAGSYTQILCANPDTGYGVLPANNAWPDGMDVSRSLGLDYWSHCTSAWYIPGQGTNGGMGLGTNYGWSTNQPDAGAWLQYRVPGDISFDGGYLYVSISTNGNWSTFLHRANDWADFALPRDMSCEWGWGCYSRGNWWAFFDGQNYVGVGPTAGVAGFNLKLGCDIPDPGWTCTANGSEVRLFGGKMSLSESSAPTATASGALATNTTLSGTQSLSLSATDTGSGVYRMFVTLDGTTRDQRVMNSNGGHCADANPANANPYEFIDIYPCAGSASGTYSYDTRTWPEGTHTLQVQVQDAAGNTTTAFSRTVTVDNTAPVFTIANSSSDYSRTRDFPLADGGSGIASVSADYSTDGGTTWSPMTGVHYDSAGQAIVGTIPTSVPDGDVRVRASATDNSSNASQVGYATPMTVTVDTTAPSNAAVALGSDAATKVNDFTLAWTNPGGQIAPVAIVHYKLCTVANPASCTSGQQNLATPSQSSIHVSVPAEGAYTAVIWLEDAGGNADAAHPSGTVTLTTTSPPPPAASRAPPTTTPAPSASPGSPTRSRASTPRPSAPSRPPTTGRAGSR